MISENWRETESHHLPRGWLTERIADKDPDALSPNAVVSVAAADWLIICRMAEAARVLHRAAWEAKRGVHEGTGAHHVLSVALREVG